MDDSLNGWFLICHGSRKKRYIIIIIGSRNDSELVAKTNESTNCERIILFAFAFRIPNVEHNGFKFKIAKSCEYFILIEKSDWLKWSGKNAKILQKVSVLQMQSKILLGTRS